MPRLIARVAAGRRRSKSTIEGRGREVMRLLLQLFKLNENEICMN